MPEIRLRYREKAKKDANFSKIGLAIVGLGIFAFCYFCLYPPKHIADKELLIGLPIFGCIFILAALWLWLIYRVNPVILINEKGIRQKSFARRFVPWQAIDSLRIGGHPYGFKTVSDLDALYITVNDPKYRKSFDRGMSKVTIWISILLLIATPFIVAYALLSDHPAAMSAIAGFAALGAAYNYSKRILKNLGDREIYMSIFELEPDDATRAIDETELAKINKKLTPVIIKKLFYDKNEFYK
jgi:hypothetical protein